MPNNKIVLISSLAIVILICFSFLFINILVVQAQDTPGPDESGKQDIPPKQETLPNPLCPPGQPNCEAGNPSVLVGRIIKGVLGVVGSIALIIFIYGGFIWMTASGHSDMVQKGKDTLIWASIGLAVIFASYAIVKFIFDALAPT